ncbi:hypothetical protein UXN81_10510 [Enterobacter hormaechei]
MDEKQINISWWNTGLVPPVASKIKEPICSKKALKIEQVVIHIMEQKPIDIMILGEVAENCTSFLVNLAAKTHMGLVICTEKVDRVYFDIAILYESTKLKFIEKENLIAKTSSGSAIKCGTHLLFREEFSFEQLNIFASHWPSRLHRPEKRVIIGQKLRQHVDFILAKKSKYVILCGDYNDQPFGQSIVEGIEATKDIEIVKNKPSMLYNPFWRHLDKHVDDHTFCGSYYHKKNETDKWFTFDQMMFSSEFLKDSPGWKLDRNSSAFHSDNISEKDIGFNFLKSFDHIPIYSKIKHIE